MSLLNNPDFNPKVSIIIPVYNGSNYMKEAIDSAIAQTYQNIEIIVVNDGSNDGRKTKEIALGYGDKIRYFEKENEGVATALNLAIRNSTGKYISWLSHDDIYYPNKIERQVEELSKLNDKGTILFSSFDILNESKKSKNGISPLENFTSEEPFYKFDMMDIFFSSKLHGCTLLIPKKHFDNIGYFDIEHKTIQDYVLFIKFHKSGIKYHYIKDTLITARHHAEQDTQKILPLHFKELNFLYRWAFDLFKDEFQKMPLWQFDHFLEIIKIRTLDKVYAHMISEWANGEWNKGKPIIWMYWENKDGAQTPDFIRLCWKTIIHNNKYDFQIKLLTEDDIETYLPNINKKYKLLKEIAHQADYIRFALLYEYGGVWSDSDMICFRSLNEVKSVINDHEFVCTGYNQTNNTIFPLIAFLGSKPKNIICGNVLTNIDNILERLSCDINLQPRWDEIGGYNLAKFVNDQNHKYFIYDSSYFLPFPCYHIDSVNDKNIYKPGIIFIEKNNKFAFMQSISNSLVGPKFKDLTQSNLISKKGLISDMFRLAFNVVLNLDEYNSSKNQLITKNEIGSRKFYLFGLLPLITITYDTNGFHVKLVKFITFFKKKIVKNKAKYYLFSILLLQIKSK